MSDMMRLLSAGRSADPRGIAVLHRRLRAWYRRERRALPWRGTRDPYRIWVSEVMLQQTQIATALPFYQGFVDRFPTVADLARAEPDDVLRSWSGLGYYRRARNLHAAAHLVMRDHGGRVPADPEQFARLPGVGRYTLGAVLSMAFDRRLPVLDGNVARVLSRLAARPWSHRDPRQARRLWELAERVLPAGNAGDWNQALMELGATVCVPRGPKCAECPIRALCAAHAANAVGRYPPVARRAATVRARRAVVEARRGARWLLAARRGALLDGLWEPPGVEIAAGDSAPRVRRKLAAELARHGVRGALARTETLVRHRITHRAIEVEVWRCEVAVAAADAGGARWVDPARPSVALTGLARRLMGVASTTRRAARARAS
jgi:A/G-specific adenine glycosylase